MRAFLLSLLLVGACVALVPAASATCVEGVCAPTCHLTYSEKITIYNVDGRPTVVPVPNGYQCS